MIELPGPDSSTPSHARPRRERSTRYPGVNLEVCLAFCSEIEQRGVDGLSSSAIASALGFTNIKTNTFSARLSAARQFGLLNLTGEGYALTPLARAILHPVDTADLPRLHRQALLKPPLYAELAERMAGKKVPEAAILGNVLYHHHQIISTAKQAAAEAFLESARFAGALGSDQVLRPEGAPTLDAPPSTAPASRPDAPTRPPSPPRREASPDPSPPARSRTAAGAEVRLDLRLWDEDTGKTIRLRAPQSITPESYERFLQAFRLMVRVEKPTS